MIRFTLRAQKQDHAVNDATERTNINGIAFGIL